jgi:hypothetical protein
MPQSSLRGIFLFIITPILPQIFKYLLAKKIVHIFATEKALLGSEGPGSTKAVYVA